ncbi:Diaminopimelate epimerase [hydrothermal vent metagenome]|uniref:diaminopimelate epimerase n=1 Tax=hydrothermal vent metagenome TaxID=652676 RepID=A0A3B1A5E9_9ZZZZ
MLIKFTKMHGLGNDFVVIDTINQVVKLSTSQIQFMANRNLGIGCDQLLLVEASKRNGVDFNYRIFNSNGGEVEQCGNGARCFAQYIKEHGLSDKTQFTVETSSGLIELMLLDDDTTGGLVTVNMGVPIFIPEKIPFVSDTVKDHYTILIDNESHEIRVVSVGNPHAVLIVDDLDTAPVTALGSKIELAAEFPNRVNVGFMQIVDRGNIRLRVFERSVGETQACGTGACAAVVLGIQSALLDNEVNVALTGGNLKIAWQQADQAVMMTGTATTVYEGQIEL